MSNIDRVREHMKKNKTAEEVFHVLALRSRNRKEPMRLNKLRYDMMKEGFNPKTTEFYDTFKLLSDLGFGKMDGIRFTWIMPVREFARQLFGVEKPSMRQFLKVGQPKPESITRTVNKVQTDSKVAIICVNGKVAKLELPEGLDVHMVIDSLRSTG